MIDVRHTGELYLGRVAVRDKFVNEAIKHGVPLRIKHDNTFMIVHAKDIKERVVGKSDHTVPDQFSADRHYLIYFVWRPSERFAQRSMFQKGKDYVTNKNT